MSFLPCMLVYVRVSDTGACQTSAATVNHGTITCPRNEDGTDTVPRGGTCSLACDKGYFPSTQSATVTCIAGTFTKDTTCIGTQLVELQACHMDDPPPDCKSLPSVDDLPTTCPAMMQSRPVCCEQHVHHADNVPNLTPNSSLLTLLHCCVCLCLIQVNHVMLLGSKAAPSYTLP